MRYRLDVNVLIALIDPAHVQHDEVHAWFGRVGHKSFATCPISENGLLRIVGHPKYPNSPGPPSAVASALAAIRELLGHAVRADSISVTDGRFADALLLSSHSRVTDSCLLALARANSGKLATGARNWRRKWWPMAGRHWPSSEQISPPRPTGPAGGGCMKPAQVMQRGRRG